MKKIIFFGAIAFSMSLTSCSIMYPGMGTDATSSKVHVVEKKVFLGIAKDIDLSLSNVAKKGGITKIATVDYGVKVGLISTTYKIKITGE